MAATLGTAMLGLTVGCARCHDHKFDPIPTADYYRLLATFTTTVRSEVDLDLDPDADQAGPRANTTPSTPRSSRRRDVRTPRPLPARLRSAGWPVATQETQPRRAG